jgi:hypothetical protein
MLSLSRFPEISPWPGESTRKMRGLQGRLAPVVNFGGIHARFARGADEGVRPYTSELYRDRRRATDHLTDSFAACSVRRGCLGAGIRSHSKHNHSRFGPRRDGHSRQRI